MWKKIPVLGSFPFVISETNEDRGMRLYDTAERKQKMDELRGLMNLTKEAGMCSARKMKQEINVTSIRHMELSR